MRLARPLMLLVLALVVTTGSLVAQERRPDRWQAVLDNGDIVWDFRLVKLQGDQLQVRQSDTLAVIAVGTIKELRLIQPSEMRIGTGNVAGATGALTGSDDVVFDLTPLDFAARLRAVQQIMTKYPAE